ncbi:MAG: hypothetical protein C4304_08455 [candidate division GAL15 bacterium]
MGDPVAVRSVRAAAVFAHHPAGVARGCKPTGGGAHAAAGPAPGRPVRRPGGARGMGGPAAAPGGGPECGHLPHPNTLRAQPA